MLLNGFYSLKRVTTFFVIFQATVVLLIVWKFNNDSKQKYSYDPELIEMYLKNPEFQVSNRGTERRFANNEVYLDSNGVYRSVEDIEFKAVNNRDHDSDIESSNVKIMDAEKDHHHEKLDLYNVKGEETREFPDTINNQKKRVGKGHRNFRESHKILRNTSVVSEEEFIQSQLESSLVLDSKMGNLTKVISQRVKNANKRFVADKRILFSEVYEEIEMAKDVQLLVIVSSSAKKRDRRDAIRASWWEECPQNEMVKCYFFTDDFNSKKLSAIKNELLHESRTYNDMIFQPIDTGVKFGYRFLYQLQWAMAHYKFQYLLRVDDDVLLCLRRLVKDLQKLHNTNLLWGYLHCQQDGAVLIDEGITMLSHGLVEQFLSQNPYRMRCHVYGDQQLALWIQDLDLEASNIYVHDERIHHSPAASKMRNYFEELDSICSNHVALHGVYPEEMEDFWAKKRPKDYKPYNQVPIREICNLDLSYQWTKFKTVFHYQPKYCYRKPQWKVFLESKGGEFLGREERPDKEQLWSKMNFGN